MQSQEKKELKILACKVRLGIIEAVYNAQSGHPGGSLSIADTLTYLYYKELNIDPKNPKMSNRDRLVLSKGHTSPALYSVLANRGFFPLSELKKFRHTNAMLQGHPDMKGVPGVDMSTGSLGHGISAAVGMAISAKLFNNSCRVYAIVGDGELEEGMVWEAFMLAAHRKLDNLCVIIDNNGLQMDGKIDAVCSPYPIDEKMKAFGFHVIEICGHCFTEIENAFNQAKQIKSKPTAIIQKSIKGKGISFMENQVGWHGVAPNKEQYELAKKELEDSLLELEG